MKVGETAPQMPPRASAAERAIERSMHKFIDDLVVPGFGACIAERVAAAARAGDMVVTLLLFEGTAPATSDDVDALRHIDMPLTTCVRFMSRCARVHAFRESVEFARHTHGYLSAIVTRAHLIDAPDETSTVSIRASRDESEMHFFGFVPLRAEPAQRLEHAHAASRRRARPSHRRPAASKSKVRSAMTL